MTTDSPAVKELARWYVEDVLNEGRTEVLSQRLGADFTLHVPPSLAEGPVVQGPEGVASPPTSGTRQTR